MLQEASIIDQPILNNGVYFDHKCDKVAMKTSWVGKEDGLLVHDRNSNGIIDDGSELFGNFTQIKDKDGNQKLAKHGYEALANLDSNNDGVIDINDKEFNKLRIWQDINKDGVSQINELKTLDELNIKSLNLNYKVVSQNYGKQINF